MRLFLYSVLSVLIVTFVAAPAFSGGQAEDDPDEPVEISFWDHNAGPDRTGYYEELIDRFEEQHPDIRVEYTGLPYENSRDRYEVAMAADDLPDVGGLSAEWVASFSQRDALMALDDWFEESELSEKISPVYINILRDLAPDDQLYAIPFSANGTTLWYRVDWFEDEGLDHPPETYEEFFDAIRALRDEDENRFGHSIRGGHGGQYNLTDMIGFYSGETSIIDENGNSILNEPEIIEFVDEYLGLYREGYTPEADITLGYRDMITNFTTGLVGSIMHNLGSQPNHSDAFESDQYSNAPPPQGPHGRSPVVQTDSIIRGVFNGTDHPEAAWTFVEWLSGHEAQSYWNEQIGQMPTHADALEDEFFQEAEHIQILSEALSDPDARGFSRPLQYPDWPNIVDEVLIPGIQGVMAGDRSTEDFMLEWHDAMEAAHEEWEEQQ